MQIPGKNGELGILPGHAPLITELQIGEISYRPGGTMQYLAVAWGFAEVLPDKVTILADAAERAEDIDVKRAQEAKARAEEALRQGAADLDYDATLLCVAPRRSSSGSCGTRRTDGSRALEGLNSGQRFPLSAVSAFYKKQSTEIGF